MKKHLSLDLSDFYYAFLWSSLPQYPNGGITTSSINKGQWIGLWRLFLCSYNKKDVLTICFFEGWLATKCNSTLAPGFDCVWARRAHTRFRSQRTLSCRTQTPGLLLGLVMEWVFNFYPPLAKILSFF